MKRKANRYLRGNRYEVKVKRELEKQGWIVYKPVRTRFSQKDIFGMWNLLCWNPKKEILYFIQLTTDKYIAEKQAREKLKNFDIKWIKFAIISLEVDYEKFENVHLTKMVKTIKNTNWSELKQENNKLI